ncbi:MAG: hypothetical protein QOE90_1246 [Thermoplasmata archaeon]|jgi:hypothetical protein|nr:hypothetical protein [Thermoplasmata archaeon]
MRTMILVLLVLAILAAAPLTASSSGITGTCDPHQVFHHYTFLPPPTASSGNQVTFDGTTVHSWDSCVDPINHPQGDGENDMGQFGAQFLETDASACALPNGHHASGSGTGAHVVGNVGGFDVAFALGSDGQVPSLPASGATACRGDGIISGDYDTAPFDCGSGQIGDAATDTPATLAGNPNPHDGSTTDPDPWVTTYGAVAQGAVRADPNGGDCTGADGSAWAALFTGPVSVGLVLCHDQTCQIVHPSYILSVPTDGYIWD